MRCIYITRKYIVFRFTTITYSILHRVICIIWCGITITLWYKITSKLFDRCNIKII
nr:MAG TPA: hypothetical protein [Caudoviricetes sp.]